MSAEAVMFLKLVLTNLFLMTQFAFATLDPKTDPHSVAKDIWKSEIKKKLPEELCKIEEEFLSCYSITENECSKNLKKWTASCVEKQTLPDFIFSDVEGEQFGYDVGLCVGQNFDLMFGAKRKDISSCRTIVRDDFVEGEL